MSLGRIIFTKTYYPIGIWGSAVYWCQTIWIIGIARTANRCNYKVRVISTNSNLFLNSFLNFLDDLNFLLGLNTFSFLSKNLDFLNFMNGQFKLILEKYILILECFDLLTEFFILNFIFLSIDLFNKPILLLGQILYIFGNLI